MMLTGMLGKITLADLSPLANHLWQSTLCVVAVWLLTLALKKNRAAVRYWLWLAASVKFLIPFSLLVSRRRSIRMADGSGDDHCSASVVFRDRGHRPSLCRFGSGTSGRYAAGFKSASSDSLECVASGFFGEHRSRGSAAGGRCRAIRQRCDPIGARLANSGDVLPIRASSLECSAFLSQCCYCPRASPTV